jgi:hypothetical protein
MKTAESTTTGGGMDATYQDRNGAPSSAWDRRPATDRDDSGGCAAEKAQQATEEEMSNRNLLLLSHAVEDGAL